MKMAYASLRLVIHIDYHAVKSRHLIPFFLGVIYSLAHCYRLFLAVFVSERQADVLSHLDLDLCSNKNLHCM